MISSFEQNYCLYLRLIALLSKFAVWNDANLAKFALPVRDSRQVKLVLREFKTPHFMLIIQSRANRLPL
jgi:hypothetical protein